MKKCPCCQTEYPDDAVFCKTCGKKLIEANVCPKCGKEIDDDTVYCPHCGHNLKAEAKNSHTREDIEKYKIELNNLKGKKAGMKVGGAICLGVGIAMFLLCLIGIILIGINFKENGFDIAMLVLSSIGACLSELVLIPIGVILLVVQAAVFTKKISNREQAIREYEGK